MKKNQKASCLQDQQQEQSHPKSCILGVQQLLPYHLQRRASDHSHQQQYSWQ